jgi:hypothetical protein
VVLGRGLEGLELGEGGLVAGLDVLLAARALAALGEPLLLLQAPVRR